MGWDWVPLGQCCEIVSGSTPKRNKPDYWDGDIAWVTPKDISSLNGAVLSEAPEYITETGYRSCSTKLLPKGTILFSSRAPIGLVAIAGRDMCTNQGFKNLIPGEDVDSLFLYYCMKWLAPRVAALGTGATFKEVNKKVVSEFKIPLPPLPEQKRIATILDKADAIRRKRQDAIALADTFLRSVFQNMFGFSKDLHKRWETKKVRETGKVQLGRQRSPKYQTGEYTTPYVRVANVFEDRIDLTSLFSMDFNEKDYPKYELQYGDILLNEGQSTELVGRPAMWRNEVANCCYQNTLVRFQVDSDQLTPEYALHLFLTYFRAGEFAKISSKTSSVAHLGAGRFADMLMPLPPLSMQKKFSGIVQQYQKVKDDLKIAVTQNNDLFSSLQQRAFRGDL